MTQDHRYQRVLGERRYMGLAFADREELTQPRAAFEAHVEHLLQARQPLVPLPLLQSTHRVEY